MKECSDPDRKWYSYRQICYATMEREAAEAALSALRAQDANWHDGTFRNWSKERDEYHPYPAGAGEVVGVADTNLAPWDKFTTELDASPVPPASGGEVVPDEHREY